MLSPWDAYAWFDTPLERVIAAATITAPVQVCGNEVRRVVLILDTKTGADATFSTQNQVMDQGILVTKGRGPLTLTQATHGVLCQVPWYCTSGAQPDITVIEVRLRDWPHSEVGPPDA